MRTYSHLISLPTFMDRYRYLQLSGSVGEETYGFDRWINQKFYKSREWKNLRNYIIVRDTGCNDYCLDLGCSGHFIMGPVLIHHMNPIRKEDIEKNTNILLDPEYLISTQLRTHNAIHYGDDNILRDQCVWEERRPNDTCPWKK